MIDYQAIVENLEVDKVKNLLIELGADVIEKENYLICSTICHNEDASEASKKLYYYKNTHMFYCYTECGPLSIFKFLKNYYETRQITYDWYKDIFLVIQNCSASKVQGVDSYKSIRTDYEPRQARELEIYPKGILDVFVKQYPIEWLKDHISREAMDKYDIRYSISQNKIIIPHYNINGDLVGIRGRALNQEDIDNFGKYMPVQIEGKWYSHPLSLNLYGIDKNWKNIKESGVALICESEKSVLQAESFEMKNYMLASCGSNFNKFQLDLLMKTCAPRYITICYDREELPGESTYFDKLWKMCKKYSNYCNMSFIYDRNGITNMKDSPTDDGEEKFIKLLEERVIVK